jgi:hypothetical protein
MLSICVQGAYLELRDRTILALSDVGTHLSAQLLLVHRLGQQGAFLWALPFLSSTVICARVPMCQFPLPVEPICQP